MNKKQLSKFKLWFDRFVGGFYGHDEYVNANIKLKEDHSRRVCTEMLYLADELKLDENHRLLAETTGLFHDVGRFPQFARFRTYSDPRSVNHCALAIEVLKEEKIFSTLTAEEKETVETAILYHGAKELPANLTGDALMLSKMIRDADKLDIYNVMIKSFIRQRNEPEKFKLEVEFPDTPGYTQEVLDAVMEGQLVDYKRLKCLNDMKLCVLGWVYDVNFPAALKRILQCGYIDLIFRFLPDTPETAKVRDKILAYVDSRIK
jgi:hypothetical protein